MPNDQVAGTPARGSEPLRVGVTGHRPNRLLAMDPPLLRWRIEATLAALARLACPEAARPLSDGSGARRGCLTVVSSLAEGADRLVCEVAWRAGFTLVYVLPFPRDEFAADFALASSRAEYRALLARAAQVIELPGSRAAVGDSDAYAVAGEAILDRIDLLLAIWDGEEARGLGGTENVVRRALERGLPVVWIAAAAPHEIRLLDPDAGDTLLTDGPEQLPALLRRHPRSGGAG